MATLTTSASNLYDLLAVVADFAEDNGWTIEYNNTDAGRQLGLRKSTCWVSMGNQLNFSYEDASHFIINDPYNGGTITDARMRACLCRERFLRTDRYFFGQDSLDVYDNRYQGDGPPGTNDLAGPFNNVWLFSGENGDHVHVVAQSAADRYTHFSFGIIDKKGLGYGPDAAFLAANYHQWYPSDDDPSSLSFDANNFTGIYSNSNFGSMLEAEGSNIYVPDGVLDPAYGFPAGPYLTEDPVQPITGFNRAEDHIDGQPGRMLDFVAAVYNQTTTGGIPMYAMPVFVTPDGSGAESNLRTYLGDLPDLRFLNIANVNPGQIIEFGNEQWQCFPAKRKTDRTAAYGGTNPLPGASSVDMGFAYKVS